MKSKCSPKGKAHTDAKHGSKPHKAGKMGKK